jgi:site-specific recombinase XerC
MSTTTLAELVDVWLDHLRTEARLEATTINEYERVLRKLVVPVVISPSV